MTHLRMVNRKRANAATASALLNAAQRLGADVSPKMCPQEVDLRHRGVGVGAGVGESVAERRHAEDAAAVREDALAVAARAGVEHLHARQPPGVAQALDDLPLPVR